MAHMLPPSAVTVLVPFARSLESAMFGYGTGRLFGGVLHTSGTVAIETPELPVCTRLRLLTLTVTVMASPGCCRSHPNCSVRPPSAHELRLCYVASLDLMHVPAALQHVRFLDDESFLEAVQRVMARHRRLPHHR